MTKARPGDRVMEESERVGHAGRSGEILEVIGEGDGIHYRVRWEDGHESTFFPSMGSVRIVHPARSRK